ncbi:hypothetical protein ACJ72_03730 [Emergomyces africanus]|uniref:Sorting nexin MVP1 n=1 Tax=Emergomyces africanus TaxID=1955775 RepID=A0A1B7NYS4_9EURO|nr:hypothetical protein ACJ72_03730 [Emergomyces africanus]
MSLFGTSPEDPPVAKDSSASRSKSLFSDQPALGTTSSSSLFADDSPGDPATWNSPNPKRAARHELVKMLLPASEVPEGYIDAYDVVLDSGDKLGAGISVEGAKKVLQDTGLSAEEQATVLNMVVPGGRDLPNGLGRGEFNVLLALIGLAQEGEDLTFDTIDERRKRLPRPNLPYVDRLKSHNSEATAQHHKAVPVPHQSPPRQMTQGSLGDSDPWGSPALHRDHHHPTENGIGASPGTNGFVTPSLSSANGFAHRISSAYNVQADSASGGDQTAGQPSENTPGSVVSGWGDNFSNPSGAGFGNTGNSGLGDGFGQSGDGQGNSNSNTISRSIGGGRVTTQGVEEVITINMLPEKEGMFFFQHRNYEVKSSRRGSSVIRRYSDFVWLVDCLQKRYPFRQIPLLPPKRVAVNGTHLAADSNSFLDKRRKGLVRFANSLVRHPVLNQEQLVVMFLTVPTVRDESYI